MISRPQMMPPLGVGSSTGASLTWSVRSELLFLELMIDHMEQGGHCTLIVPDGILFRKDRACRRLRERLLTECIVRAVVRLPMGIFSNAPGIRCSLLIFEQGTAQADVIRYYEVPSLTKYSARRCSPPADVLDGAIAWVLEGERDCYSWEVEVHDVKQGDWSLDLRLPMTYGVSDRSGKAGQLQLFAPPDYFDYDAATSLAPWVEERGERAKSSIPTRFLGISKRGIVSFKGKSAATTHRYRRVEAGDFVYNPMRAEIGAIALCRSAREEGWVSPDYVVFRLTNDAPFDAAHLLRFLKSEIGEFEVSRHSHGSVRRRLRYEDLQQIVVPYPDRRQ